MSLDESLKQYRKQAGLSQLAVAEKLNISRQAISQWENGKSYPDIDNLIVLSSIYHFSLDELFAQHPGLQEKIITKSKQSDSVTTSNTNKTISTPIKDNSLVLLLFSLLFFAIPPIGTIGAPIVIWYNKKTNRFWRLILFVAIAALVYNIFASVLIILDLLNWGITSIS